MENITTYAQLGGTVVTVVLFLNYLTKRDNKWTESLKYHNDSNVILAKSLQKLTDVVEQNNRVLNSTSRSRDDNTVAVVKNTEVIDKGTKIIVEKVNGN